MPTSLLSSVISVIPLGDSVVDMGAGVGHFVSHMRDKGYDIFGLDGSEGIEQLTGGLVKRVDLVSSDCSRFFGAADWGLFLEVGEHIPREFEQQLIDNVSRIPRKGLIVSWATPGQVWHGEHVNCQTIKYVQGEFAKRGWQVDKRKTRIIRMGRTKRKRVMTVYSRVKT